MTLAGEGFQLGGNETCLTLFRVFLLRRTAILSAPRPSLCPPRGVGPEAAGSPPEGAQGVAVGRTEGGRWPAGVAAPLKEPRSTLCPQRTC